MHLVLAHPYHLTTGNSEGNATDDDDGEKRSVLSILKDTRGIETPGNNQARGNLGAAEKKVVQTARANIEKESVQRALEREGNFASEHSRKKTRNLPREKSILIAFEFAQPSRVVIFSDAISPGTNYLGGPHEA